MIIQRKKAITENSSILTDEESDKNDEDSNLVESSDDPRSYENGVENV